MLTVYARKEPAIDWYLKKYAPRHQRFDIQIYRDKALTKKMARFEWFQKKPTLNSKTVVCNCYRWRLEWVNIHE